MRGPAVLLVFLFAALLVSVAPVSAQDVSRRDGNWWLAKNDSDGKGAVVKDGMIKRAYLMGLIDGAALLGANVAAETARAEGAARAKADPNPFAAISGVEAELSSLSGLVAYQNTALEYLDNITVGQLRDGLDALYADFRNRGIIVVAASWVVLNQISGTSPARIDSMLERLRKSKQ